MFSLSEAEREMSSGKQAHTLVLAIGNPLRGDDGVGQAVLTALEAAGLPPGVEATDGGAAGLETVLSLQGYGRVFIVDAADMRATPGMWSRFTTNDASLQPADFHERLTVHYAGLAEALALGDALGVLPPEIVIYGIQPLTLEWSPGLSAPVRDAIPAVCAAILSELRPQAK
jgi:hydrogenase maturation protease